MKSQDVAKNFTLTKQHISDHITDALCFEVCYIVPKNQAKFLYQTQLVELLFDEYCAVHEKKAIICKKKDPPLL